MLEAGKKGECFLTSAPRSAEPRSTLLKCLLIFHHEDKEDVQQDRPHVSRVHVHVLAGFEKIISHE